VESLLTLLNKTLKIKPILLLENQSEFEQTKKPNFSFF
jgi:hypothetical protein